MSPLFLNYFTKNTQFKQVLNNKKGKVFADHKNPAPKSLATGFSTYQVERSTYSICQKNLFITIASEIFYGRRKDLY
jgi:hypothetical protein